MKKLIIALFSIAGLVGCGSGSSGGSTPPVGQPPTDDGGRMPENDLPWRDESIDRGIDPHFISDDFIIEAGNLGYTDDEISTLCNTIDGYYVDCIIERDDAVVKIFRPQNDRESGVEGVSVFDTESVTTINLTTPSIVWTGAFKYSSTNHMLSTGSNGLNSSLFFTKSGANTGLSREFFIDASDDSLSLKTWHVSRFTTEDFTKDEALFLMGDYSRVSADSRKVYVTIGSIQVDVSPSPWYTDATRSITDELSKRSIIMIEKGWY